MLGEGGEGGTEGRKLGQFVGLRPGLSARGENQYHLYRASDCHCGVGAICDRHLASESATVKQVHELEFSDGTALDSLIV